MQDEHLDNLLCDWSNDQLPNDETREKILQGVSVRSEPADLRPPLLWKTAAALSGIIAVAATILFLVAPPPLPEPTAVVQVAPPQEADEKIRISLIVLKKLPDSETAVEFLEDAIMLAEGKTLHELKLSEHRFFLWIYPLEETLFALDIGIDKAAETGIVAVPDRPMALQLNSNGDRFDVFVSVLPQT